MHPFKLSFQSIKWGRITLTKIKWVDIHSPALWDAEACCWHCISTPHMGSRRSPQGWLWEPIPSFLKNKHKNMYQFYIWYNLNQFHWINLILLLISSALPVAPPPAWAPSPSWGHDFRSCITISFWGSLFSKLGIVLIYHTTFCWQLWQQFSRGKF